MLGAMPTQCLGATPSCVTPHNGRQSGDKSEQSIPCAKTHSRITNASESLSQASKSITSNRYRLIQN